MHQILVCGAHRSGKSTLIRILAKDPKFRGAITFHERSLPNNLPKVDGIIYLRDMTINPDTHEKWMKAIEILGVPFIECINKCDNVKRIIGFTGILLSCEINYHTAGPISAILEKI